MVQSNVSESGEVLTKAGEPKAALSERLDSEDNRCLLNFNQALTELQVALQLAEQVIEQAQLRLKHAQQLHDVAVFAREALVRELRMRCRFSEANVTTANGVVHRAVS